MKELAKAGEKKTGFGKLIQNDKGSIIYRMINRGYTLFMIVGAFSRRLLWFGSCAAFLWIFPVSYELFCEQQKILMKMQMSEMQSMMGGGGAEPPQVRPF